MPFLSLTSGPHGLVAEVRTASAHDVDRTISELRALDDVVGVDTLTYVEVVRDVIGPVGEMRTEVDEVDLALLRALQDDGRASYVDLAAVVGPFAGRSTAASRTSRRVAGRPDRRGRPTFGSGSAERDGPWGTAGRGPPWSRRPLATAMPSVIFVARTLGRFDVLVTVRAFSAAQFVELLDIVRAMPGVNSVESWAHLEVVKESYASGLDVSHGRA